MPPRKPHPTMSEVALALAQRPRSEPACNVKIGRTSGGDITLQVDVEDVDVRAAAKLAQSVFDGLARKYPRAKA